MGFSYIHDTHIQDHKHIFEQYIFNHDGWCSSFGTCGRFDVTQTWKLGDPHQYPEIVTVVPTLINDVFALENIMDFDKAPVLFTHKNDIYG